MLKSMSGFASVSREGEVATVDVTVRTLNSRFVDLHLRLPPALGQLEAPLRHEVHQHVTRGRVEVSVSVQFHRPPDVEVTLNAQLGRGVAGAIAAARAEGLVSGDLTPGDLLRVPHAMVIAERPLERDSALVATVSTEIVEACREALRTVGRMRQTEGAHLLTDLTERRRTVAGLVEQVATAAAEGTEDLQARLTARVAELGVDVQADPAAIAAEVVRFAARADISEEVTRFRAHSAHWDALTGGQEPCGRKLDFLLQEMNREVNTMASKANGVDVGPAIVDAKAELEKMKEQVQNVE